MVSVSGYKTNQEKKQRELSCFLKNLDERNVDLKLDVILESLNLAEKSVHNLRYDSGLAAVSAASPHCVCFTGTSLPC